MTPIIARLPDDWDKLDPANTNTPLPVRGSREHTAQWLRDIADTVEAHADMGVPLDLADTRRLVVALRLVVWRVSGVDDGDGWRRV